ncbi:hypothetical protein SCLCIDRAFT_869220 [Scleroderma citrinum Foug A]|uniref:Uncharacterized protein n=1 Tax=Scleroderma citrinum Foug A TaxID=1036808 RepID=A0A0C2ZJ45_9AGAM|nr:hypothetical protein SCLCIDRAFT_869220 [Scleroderma citrinum Foug A]
MNHPTLGSLTIEDDSDVLSLGTLPPLAPRFFLPRLQDKPHDPICDGIEFGRSALNASECDSDSLFPRPRSPPHTASVEKSPVPLWRQALMHPFHEDRTLSWVGDHPFKISDSVKTPFLTEQPAPLYDLVHHRSALSNHI